MLATQGSRCTLLGIFEGSVKVTSAGGGMQWQAAWLRPCVSCSVCPVSKQSCHHGSLYKIQSVKRTAVQSAEVWKERTKHLYLSRQGHYTVVIRNKRLFSRYKAEQWQKNSDPLLKIAALFCLGKDLDPYPKCISPGFKITQECYYHLLMLIISQTFLIQCITNYKLICKVQLLLHKKVQYFSI